jgi:hypothetical protein
LEVQEVKIKFQAQAYEKFVLFKKENPDYIWPSPKSREKKAAQVAAGLAPSPLSAGAPPGASQDIGRLLDYHLSASMMSAPPTNLDYAVVSTATGTIKRVVVDQSDKLPGYLPVQTENGTLKRVLKAPSFDFSNSGYPSHGDFPHILDQPTLHHLSANDYLSMQMNNEFSIQPQNTQQPQNQYFQGDFPNQMNSLNVPQPLFDIGIERTPMGSPLGSPMDFSFMDQVMQQKNVDSSFDDWWDSFSIASTESNASQSSSSFNPY